MRETIIIDAEAFNVLLKKQFGLGIIVGLSISLLSESYFSRKARKKAEKKEETKEDFLD